LFTRLILISILIISGFIHLWNVGGFPAQDADEGVYIQKALHFSKGLGIEDPLRPYYNPFFGQIIIGAFFKVVGYPGLYNPSFTVKSMDTLYSIPRVLMGILAIIDTLLLYLICRRIYNNNVALLSSFLFAVMPITWLLRMVYLDNILLPFLLCSIWFAISVNKPSNAINNSPKNTLLIILSGIFLGVAILTKIPAFTLIPLVGYLIYNRSNKKVRDIGLWLIPIFLIPLLWPAHALYLGDLDEWIDGVTHQALERHASHGLLFALNQFYLIDPILLILGLGSTGLIVLLRRDLMPVIWVGPLLLFFYLIHYASVFHFILIIPAFCIAISVIVEDVSKRIGKITFLKKENVNHVLRYCLVNLPFLIVGIVGMFGFLVTTTLISVNTASFQHEAAAFVARSMNNSLALNVSPADKNITLVTGSVYYWLFIYVFHFDHVFHKVNITGLNSTVPEKVILMVDEPFKEDLSIKGNSPDYSNTTKDYLSLTDNDSGTRWKGEGEKGWVEADLGKPKFVCSADISWYRGDGRVYNFVIKTSIDGSSYKNAFAENSSGTSTRPEKYLMNTSARYVKIEVNGNSDNKNASISQIDLFGIDINQSNRTSCNNLKIIGLKTDKGASYENANFSKRKNTLLMLYYATDSVKVFNGSADNYDLDRYPYTSMLHPPVGSFLDVRKNED
jgi:4-amino-4-deoxy-L-arabinose transferase-like glycosyltransferase